MRKTGLGSFTEVFSMGITDANKSNGEYQQKPWKKKKNKKGLAIVSMKQNFFFF